MSWLLRVGQLKGRRWADLVSNRGLDFDVGLEKRPFAMRVAAFFGEEQKRR